MQALLVLYMTHRLLPPGHVEHIAGFVVLRAALERIYGPMSSQALASVIFGWYAGLVYVAPIAGGMLADRLLGRRRTVTLGACLMAAGHFLMASEATFVLALLFLLVGAGCFKGNLAVQVGTLYSPDDTRVDGAFQLYYVVINLAVIASPLVCGTLGEHYGYHWGFGAAGAGMLIGLAIYLHGRKWLPPEQQARRNDNGKSSQQLLRGELRRVIVMLLLVPALGVSLVGNMQISNAYLLWAETNYQLQVFGITMPVTWILSLSCIISVVTLAASMMFWRWWAKYRAEPSEIWKIILGAFMMACAPLILAAASYVVATTGHKVTLVWAVVFEFVNDFGYANVVPVGLALYSRSAPKAVGRWHDDRRILRYLLLRKYAGGLDRRVPRPHAWNRVLAATRGCCFQRGAVAVSSARNAAQGFTTIMPTHRASFVGPIADLRERRLLPFPSGASGLTRVPRAEIGNEDIHPAKSENNSPHCFLEGGQRDFAVGSE